MLLKLVSGAPWKLASSTCATPYATPFSVMLSAVQSVAQLELPTATAIPATSVPCSHPALPCPHNGFRSAVDGRSKLTSRNSGWSSSILSVRIARLPVLSGATPLPPVYPTAHQLGAPTEAVSSANAPIAP